LKKRVKEIAEKTKVNIQARLAKVREQMRVRIANIRLRGYYFRIYNRSKVIAKSMSYQIGVSLASIKSDKSALLALSKAKKRSESTITYLKKQIADFKTKVPKSGASTKVQAWAIKSIDEALTKVEEINKGINIFNDIAKTRLDFNNELLAKRKEIGKQLYLFNTNAPRTNSMVKLLNPT